MIPPWVSDLIVIAPWLVAAIVLVLAVAKLWQPALKLMRFIDDVTGALARPGVPARPGLMERVGAIEHEVRTNHGTSLKDAIRRIETSQAEHRQEATEQFRQVHERLDAQVAVDEQLRADFDSTLNPYEHDGGQP